MEFKTKEVKNRQSPVYNTNEEKKLLETMQKELEKDVKTYLDINTPKSIANASESQNQLNIITELLPKPATDNEINNIIYVWILENGDISSKDMGKVIGYVSNILPNARKSDIAKLVKSNIKK